MHLSRSAVIVDFLKLNKPDIVGSKSGRAKATSVRSMRGVVDAKERLKISVVVPVWNEIKIIKNFHKRLIESLSNFEQPFEIIYVDDNSNDGTYEWLATRVTKSKIIEEVLVFKKQGKKGKAYSLVEGFDAARGDIFVMIDADLQYDPSVIPEMVKKLAGADVVVADRRYEKISFVRKAVSKTFRYFFGKFLFDLDCDVQSGLKVFKSEVYKTTRFSPSSGWTFDLEFLHRAKYAGFSIKNYAISFFKRISGSSKVNIISSILEIGLNAISVRLKSFPPLAISALVPGTMRFAGVGYKGRKYITHTTLTDRESAMRTWSSGQGVFLLSLIYFNGVLTFVMPLTEARIIVTILTLLYFMDTIFNFSLIWRSLRKPTEVSFTDKQLENIADSELPIYSILCPLYKEARVVQQFLDAISKLDWPASKLDVILLLEEDDYETRGAVERLPLPYYVRVIVVPHSYPKTKPKACNYGLSFARGKFLVIYDAEDYPEAMQLKKAYLGFATLPKNIRCLQAKLNYYNPSQNILTRLFTAEYSLWFDLTLTGIQSLNSTIPLGGTSNHFRTEDLRQLKGWDTFNVTEDADLGVRLFKKGFKTAIIDSTTLEEANSNVFNWFRQRSRWIKGYMQTYLVHMRDLFKFARESGFGHAFVFQMTVGGKLLFLLVNPLMWLVTISYFVFYERTASIIELVYYPPVSYVAVFSMVFGNFLFFYYYVVAVAKRGQWELVKYIFLVPFYWIMMSLAGSIAFFQLFFRPHYWEKTIHGLHLQGVKRHLKAGRPVLPRYRIPMPAFNPVPGKKLLAGLYQILFLGADLVLIRLLYPDSFVYKYFYISFIGKGIYLVSLFVSFSTFPIFRRLRGHMKEEGKVSYLIFSTFLTSWIGVVVFGLLGAGSSSATFDLLSYIVAMMCFAMANVLVVYNLRRNISTFLAFAYIVSVLQLAVIYLTKADLSRILRMTVYLAGADVFLMFLLQVNKEYFKVIENNLKGIFGLLREDSIGKSWKKKQMRILIFNWRDTRHIYAGGAEVYVHELAKRWVKEGNKVTMFCGNDNRHVLNETIEGVEIFRRGGTYTVYLFAFVYYIFKFRGKYDLIIDCENGIPFFTPLYVRKPVILVIHHVHQEVIRKYLRWPVSLITGVLEAKFMPIIYKEKKIVTVSESSKEQIMKLGFAHEENIEIVYNGTSVESESFIPKAGYPLFLYLGRLQDYKNIDIAITAFSRLLKRYKEAKLKIVGFGESQVRLKKLVERLGVGDSIDFLGRVSHAEKVRLLSEAWVVLQPSEVEGWGITVIEANACGTPVIASRVHGLCDSVVDGRTGILVGKRNAESFANAMKLLINDSQLRERLSKEAYLWSRNFSWEKSANIFYNIMGKSIFSQGLSIPAYTRA